MIKKEHTIWVEKYRSDSLDNYLCDPKLKAKFQEFIDRQDLSHCLFAGKPGSGKTTIAKILANKINCDFLYINATDERGIEIIRDKIGGFASSASFKPLKIVILDEATHLLQASQVLLLNMIETYSLKTRFILTGNYADRLIPALKSRLQEFDLIPPTKKLIAEHVSNILDKEEIKYELKDLAFIITKFYPDLRRIINTCQKFTTNNILQVNENEVLAEEEYFDKIILELSKPSSKSFNIIRQVVVDSGSSSISNVYKHLYNNLDKFAGGVEGSVTVIIEEHIYHSNFVVDHEICVMSCISRILEVLQTKKIIKG